MKPEELNTFMADNQFITVLFNCHDCKEAGTIELERTSATEIQVTGGALFKSPTHWQADTPLLTKCQKCFDNDPVFHPEAEVYSRCVGYLRPVKNWNGAKQAEFSMRKTAKI